MSKKIGKIKFAILGLLFCMPALLNAAPFVTVSLEKQKVMKNSPVTVQFLVNSEEEPDSTPSWDLSSKGIETQFQMMTPNFSRSVTIVNGRRTEVKESRFTYTYQFKISEVGFYQLVGPTFYINGQAVSSPAFRIEITEVEKNPFYALALKNFESQVYVGQRLDLDLHFNFSQGVKNLSLHLEGLEGVKHQIRTRETFTNPQQITLNNAIIEGVVRTSNGNAKELYIPLTIIFDESGTVNFDKSYAALRGAPVNPRQNFFGTYEEENLIILTDPLQNSIQILPLPTPAPTQFSGLVGKINLEVDVNPKEAKVGDPLTLTVKMTNINDFTYELPLLSKNKAFTSLFSIPANRSPGRMEKGVKVWTQTIRPLNEGSYTVPPIEIHYFDSEIGQYSVTKSNSLMLEIGEAVQLGEADLIYNSAIGKDLAIEYNENRQFHNAAVTFDSKNLRSPLQSFSATTIFIIVLLSLMILMLIVVIFLFFNGFFGRWKQSSSNYLQILQDMKQFLEKNKKISSQKRFDSYSLCRNEILSLKNENHTPFLQKLDTLMFKELENSQTALVFFENEIENELKRIKTSKKQTKRKSVVLFFTLFLSFLVVGCQQEENSAVITDIQIDESLSMGQASFTQALKLMETNEKSPIADFNDAYNHWNYLSLKGVKDDRLEFNLGNVARFQGNEALALYHYKKALLIRNESLYREAINDILTKNGFAHQKEGIQSFAEELAFFSNHSPLGVKVILFLVLLFITITLFAFSHYLKRFKGGRSPILLLFECLLIFALILTLVFIVLQQTVPAPGEEGIILVDTQARFGNSFAYEKAFEQNLFVGQPVNIIEEREGWTYIKLPNGLMGWIPNETIKVIE